MGKDRIEEARRKGSRRNGRRPGATADWATADGTRLINAICQAASVGGALRFGYSRDGGAYAIGVYGDGEPYTDFVAPSEDINETLDYYVELFQDPIEAEDKPAKGKKSGPTLSEGVPA